MNHIIFKIIEHGSLDYKKAVKLREEILRKPFGLVFSPEELAYEKDHIHIAGYLEDELIATAALAAEGDIFKMQRVVVKDDIRSKGIGSAMMKHIEDLACTKGFKEIYCHARDTAVPFYLKNDYLGEGDYFDEDGIPHLKMHKMIIAAKD